MEFAMETTDHATTLDQLWILDLHPLRSRHSERVVFQHIIIIRGNDKRTCPSIHLETELLQLLLG